MKRVLLSDETINILAEIKKIYGVKKDTSIIELLARKEKAQQERLLKYQYGVTISDLIEEIKKDLPYGNIKNNL